jgi:hypothetical protein
MDYSNTLDLWYRHVPPGRVSLELMDKKPKILQRLPRVRRDNPSRRINGDVSLDAVSPTPSPRARLRLAEIGQAAVRIEDLERLLASHVLDSDERTARLARSFDQLMELFLSGDGGDKKVMMDLLTRFSELHRASSAALGRTIELLAKIGRTEPPRVQIVAAGEEVSVGPQLHVALGGSRDGRR